MIEVADTRTTYRWNLLKSKYLNVAHVVAMESDIDSSTTHVISPHAILEYWLPLRSDTSNSISLISKALSQMCGPYWIETEIQGVYL